ncbi:hypothetical protein AGABI2DRAFT_121010 [Agaricus bisporus var. bisporus H97]|uniref:hypothetical protein n=1 Tax=Agaricus bisporus var. bisporus (strain H97 / ATCC MYA-4626 / FGSC 10389) TaxID=936046 RepID=UPI00029F4FA3|nr:hypothetical protein AGABI2DRAFT_121010 [Agaricus bisporus var. bisporus H97]EKV43796.1 hypothetical protein AGABI2DRAFT_121010 [Agaricus bisporus var. bisporus H97]
MFNKTLLCLDVWNEILNYFEVSLEDDGEKVVKEKRSVMLTIALLSPGLTELALDALRKNLTTLVQIVNKANSGLDYHVSKGCWRVSYDLQITDKLLDDLIRNLKRVRNLRVQVSKKELELWQMLHALLAPRSMTHLLPCLQTLSLVSADDPQPYHSLAVISYIFAPSLTSISVRGSWGTSWGTVQHFMNLHHLPNLSRLLYFDENLAVFPRGIECFTGLRHLTLHDEHEFYAFSVLTSFVSFCGLQELVISISYGDEDRATDMSSTRLTLPALQHLQLKSETRETSDIFFRQVKLPSLVSLSLGIQHALEQELPLGSMVASYPNLLYLVLHCIETEGHSYRMSANDLMSIVNLRGMKTLKLLNIPHELQERDIFSLVKSLPVLHSLAISGSETTFSATLLVSISEFSNLRCLELPLDFSLLVDHRSSEKTSESPSELRKIISPVSKGIPDKPSAKVVLTRNILHLFPKLEEFGGTGESMMELQDVFEVVNNMFHKPSVSHLFKLSILLQTPYELSKLVNAAFELDLVPAR